MAVLVFHDPDRPVCPRRFPFRNAVCASDNQESERRATSDLRTKQAETRFRRAFASSAAPGSAEVDRSEIGHVRRLEQRGEYQSDGETADMGPPGDARLTWRRERCRDE